MSRQQRPPRLAFYLDEEAMLALSEIKAHYGFASDPMAARRALIEHAKQLREPPKTIRPITYSRRVY